MSPFFGACAAGPLVQFVAERLFEDFFYTFQPRFNQGEGMTYLSYLMRVKNNGLGRGRGGSSGSGLDLG